MATDREIQNKDSGKEPDKKYIHVNDIPIENWDENEIENDKPLEEKSEKDQSQGDETVGIP